MITYSLMFSILFFAVCIISMIFGIYVLQNNHKAQTNQCFFALIVAINFWALGLALATPAADIATSEIWRRVAAVGWGTIYSIALHFILIITGRKTLLKKWWLYMLLYLPAFVTVFAFTIPSDIFKTPYQLHWTKFGWVNLAGNSIWDWIFYVYYISYTMVGLILVLQWGKKSPYKKIKIQSRIIFLSFIAALVIGSITDILLNSISARLPQMAPIVMLIPITAMFFNIRKYEFMVSEPVDNNELILKESSVDRILHYISIVFIVGAVLSILSQWQLYDKFSLFSVFAFSGFLAAIGVLVNIISRTTIPTGVKEIIIAIVFALLIPIVTLRFFQFSGITVWATSFILMIISLVFNKRIILIAVVISSVFTQLLVWVIAPVNVIEVSSSDYLIRIALLLTTFFVAIYVSKLYVQRLKENAYQARFKSLVSEISYGFVKVNQQNLNECLYSMLETSGALTKCDSTCIVLFNETQTIKQAYEWQKDNTASLWVDLSPAIIPVWIQLLSAGGVVVLEDNKKTPPQDIRLKVIHQDVRAFVAIPIKNHDKLIGFLGFCSKMPINHWNRLLPAELGIIANITADALIKVSADDEIRFMAYYDQLTKLPNRFLLKDRLEQAVHLSARAEKIVGVIFIDLDSFKIINDSLGHQQGDELLIAVADKLKQHVRTSDTVSRCGGDEFVIILNNLIRVNDVIKIVKDILQLFQSPLVVRGQEFFLAMSAGVALYPQDGESADALIKNADIAMSEAKKLGKNQFMLCSEDMKAEAVEQLKLTNLLYRALERNQLLVYYQPQIDVQTERIIGMEALLRWNLPDIGFVSPAKFIPLAERSGLINPIGEWVLRTACLQNKKWQDMGFEPVRVAVNLSLSQLRNPNLVNLIAGILSETGLQPQFLELEITESIASDQANNLLDILDKIKELGVTISIDDFGTEYSSLSRLKNLPIDRIKIDMQFVRDIERSEKDQAIVDVIINLAKSLGIMVIAEGVETQQQLIFLNQKGCDEIQGFYYYKPKPVSEIDSLLELFYDKPAALEA